MRLMFDENGDPLPTFDLILATQSIFDRWLKNYGIKSREGHDWIHKAYAVVKDFLAHPENYTNSKSYESMLHAVHDCWEVGTALRGLQGEDYDRVVEKLELLFKSGTGRSSSEKGNSRGRDTLFELALLSDLKGAGIQARLGTLNPDILVHTKRRDYFLECKRLSATSTTALQRNLHNASKQLRSHLTGKTRGVMCISIGEYLTGGKASIKTRDNAHTDQVIQETLGNFIKQESHILRNSNAIDDCVVGVIVYSSILVEQADLKAPVQIVFTLLSDALINKGSSRNFFDFYEDFSDLLVPYRIRRP